MDRSKITLNRRCLIVFAVLSVLGLARFGAAAIPPFKFHLKTEPSLDPSQTMPGLSTYAFSNLYRGLTRYVGGSRLIFDQAERCRLKTDTLLNCKLRKESKWSDGSLVSAEDYATGFRRLLSPGSRCPVLDLLFGIKNAKAFYEGKVKADQLGITVLNPDELEFTLAEKDSEFLEKLSNPLFAPYRAPKNVQDKTTYLFNGPYKVKSWEKNRKIVLTPNEFFKSDLDKSAQKPDIEIVFAAEDSAALNLYEKGIINFLWRVNDVDIPKYRGRPDFFQIPMARYDYVGFNLRPGSPFEKKEVRKAFSEGVNYDEFKKVFQNQQAIGCPGLDEPFLSPQGHCVTFDPKGAHPTFTKPLKYMFSQLGGDDIRRQAEWFQEQWHKNIGVKIELQGMEQAHYRNLLKKSPPDIFRMGVALNRPTCLAALEKFSKDDPENYTGFNNETFNNFVRVLSRQKLSRAEQEGICGVASDILFKQEYVGIPLGKIQFTILIDPHFQGWKLNELNQLDLGQLVYVEKK